MEILLIFISNSIGLISNKIIYKNTNIYNLILRIGKPEDSYIKSLLDCYQVWIINKSNILDICSTRCLIISYYLSGIPIFLEYLLIKIKHRTETKTIVKTVPKNIEEYISIFAVRKNGLIRYVDPRHMNIIGTRDQ